MRLPLRARLARVLGAGALTAALLLPGAAPATAVTATDPVVLRVGTTQDLDSLNPVCDHPRRRLRGVRPDLQLYDRFGPNLEPVPGFAESWERAADGHSWTFKIRDGMKWSDGEPATSADACFSWGLGVEAIKAEGSLGAGYLEPSMKDAKVTAVECPDPTTLIATTDDPSDRVLQIALPIIPKHIWGKETYETIGKAKFTPPLVGTGPYQAVEWQTGQFIRLQRNPNYWGDQGFADEVDLIIYKTPDTMVQALKAGELDYAHGPNADQLNQLKTEPNIATVVGSANGWTQLAFNGYGASTGKTIPNGGPSTKALLDPAFRDALGYAVDRQALVDRVLGGYGDVGTTIVPPVLTNWHVEPTKTRTFDIELAKQKLDAAGYPLDASGNRLDKEGKPINLRMFMPDSDENYPKAAQFIAAWYGQLGVKVTTQVLSSATLTEKIYPPEGGEGYTADYDIELWGWSGGIDPNGLLQIFRCDQIGNSSDSQYCNPDFDKMYDDQLVAPTAEARKDDPRRDAEPDLRPGRLRHPVLRLEYRGVSHRPVRRLGEPARIQRRAVLHLQHAPVHETDRRDARADAGAVRGRAIGLPGRVGGGRHAGTERDHHPDQRRCRSDRPAPGRSGRPGRGGSRRSGLVQPASQRGRGCGRRRVIGSARFGGPPATLDRGCRSLTGKAG